MYMYMYMYIFRHYLLIKRTPVDQPDARLINWLCGCSTQQCIMLGCTTGWPSGCATLFPHALVKEG